MRKMRGGCGGVAAGTMTGSGKTTIFGGIGEMSVASGSERWYHSQLQRVDSSMGQLVGRGETARAPRSIRREAVPWMQ